MMKSPNKGILFTKRKIGVYIMINLKLIAKRLTITMLLLTIIVITSGFASKISTGEKGIDTFALRYTSINKTLDNKRMNAVVVRKNELLLVSLNDSDKNIILDNGGTFLALSYLPIKIRFHTLRIKFYTLQHLN